MKKGRHRRFEEARKLKQSGPEFLFSDPGRARPDPDDSEVEDDEYAELARKYGALDDEEPTAEREGEARS